MKDLNSFLRDSNKKDNDNLLNIKDQNIEDIKDLDELKSIYSECYKCQTLSSSRNNVVFGYGSKKNCKILIIGEAPGKKEDELQKPFVGRSGKLLDKLLEEIGLSREKDIYITNTVLCRPPNNRDPKKEELENCRKRLDSHIRLLNPEIIVTLGNFATKYILKTKEGITKLRGNVIKKQFNDKDVKVIPIPHPAVILYNGSSEKIMNQFRVDFNLIKENLS
ncbi:MAG: uracil-DNA glycosylase [Nanobdellota archaeon]